MIWPVSVCVWTAFVNTNNFFCIKLTLKLLFFYGIFLSKKLSEWCSWSIESNRNCFVVVQENNLLWNQNVLKIQKLVFCTKFFFKTFSECFEMRLCCFLCRRCFMEGSHMVSFHHAGSSYPANDPKRVPRRILGQFPKTTFSTAPSSSPPSSHSSSTSAAHAEPTR